MNHAVIIATNSYSAALHSTIESLQAARGKELTILIADTSEEEPQHARTLGVDSIITHSSHVPTSVGVTFNRAVGKTTADIVWLMYAGVVLPNSKSYRTIISDVFEEENPVAVLPAVESKLETFKNWFGFSVTAVGKYPLQMLIVKKADYKRIGGCIDSPQEPLSSVASRLHHLGRIKTETRQPIQTP